MTNKEATKKCKLMESWLHSNKTGCKDRDADTSPNCMVYFLKSIEQEIKIKVIMPSGVFNIHIFTF